MTTYSNDLPLQVRSLDGRDLAMLSSKQIELYRFVRQQGRKYGVVIDIQTRAPGDALATVRGERALEELLKRYVTTLSVRFGKIGCSPGTITAVAID